MRSGMCCMPCPTTPRSWMSLSRPTRISWRRPVGLSRTITGLAQRPADDHDPAQQPLTRRRWRGAANHLRWLPGLRTLFGYEAGWLRRDLVPGLVVTALLVPAEMGWLSGG